MEAKFKGLKNIQIAGILFFVGILIGVFAANLLKDYYLGDIKVLDTKYYSILTTDNLDYISLLKYTLLDHMKEFFIYWILCLTIIGIPYVILAIVYKGFGIGFLISVTTVLYGSKGILLFFAYLMPQALIYVPVILICLRKGYQLAQRSFYKTKARIDFNKSMIMGYLAVVFILMTLIIIGSLLETYLGTILLKRALEICVSMG